LFVLAIVGVAPERAALNAADRGLRKLRPVERIDLAKRHRTAIAARAVLDRT
jgi:hypothetical protein